MTYQLRNVVVAVALGLLAAVLVTVYVTNYRKHVQQGQQNVAVLVAAEDIPAGTSGLGDRRGPHAEAARPCRAPHSRPARSPAPTRSSVSSAPTRSWRASRSRPAASANAAELGVRAQLKGTHAGDPDRRERRTRCSPGTLRAGDHVDLVANIKVDNAGSQQPLRPRSCSETCSSSARRRRSIRRADCPSRRVGVGDAGRDGLAGGEALLRGQERRSRARRRTAAGRSSSGRSGTAADSPDQRREHQDGPSRRPQRGAAEPRSASRGASDEPRHLIRSASRSAST